MTQILINSQEKYYDATNHLPRNIDFKECFWVIVQLKTLSCRNLNKAQKTQTILFCASQNGEEKFQFSLSLRSGMSRLGLCIIWIFVGVLALAVTISSKGPLLMLALMRTCHQIRFCGDFTC